MLAAILKEIGIKEKDLESIYTVLDKRAKVPDDAFEEMLAEKIPDAEIRQKITQLMAAESIDNLSDIVPLLDKANESVAELKKLFQLLDTMGVTDFCKFDITVVRGLAYYTGIVFEIYDKKSQLRAIGGGGRYDNLLKQFGGPQISATGFGIGDCILGILLEEKGLLDGKSNNRQIDYFVACVDEQFAQKALEITTKIRRAGVSASFSYKATGLGKQLKQASAENAKKAIIIGEEFEKNQLAIKDMESGDQTLVDIDKFFSQL